MALASHDTGVLSQEDLGGAVPIEVVERLKELEHGLIGAYRQASASIRLRPMIGTNDFVPLWTGNWYLFR